MRSPHVRPFAVVDGPMNVEIGGNRRLAITIDVGNQTRGACEKIHGIEIEDGRQPDLASDVLDPDVSRVPDEGACGRVKLPVEGRRAERDTRKFRAADDHAIEGEVNSLVAERANDVIFEFGEGDRFSAYNERPEVEKSELPQAAETFGNAGLNDPVHCQGVVRIDVESETRIPVRELLWLRDGIDRSHECNDQIQIGVVPSQRIEIDAARVVDVSGKDLRPGGLPFADARCSCRSVQGRSTRGDQREQTKSHVSHSAKSVRYSSRFSTMYRTMAARAAVTARSHGERYVKHCRAIMVRSVKDILARSARTAGRVKHIHVTYGRPSSVPVRKRKRRHYGRHQTIRSWHGCRPGNDAVLAQGLWTDIDPRSGKSHKASPWKPLQRVRRQAGPLL